MNVRLEKSAINKLIILIILSLLPLYPSPYFRRTLFLVLYFAYLGVAWDLLGGYTGQGSFVHAAFVGLGAYTSALLFIWWRVTPYISMFIGALVSALFAGLIGYLCFRFGLRGHFFFLASIAFLVAMRYSFTNWDLVGGATGLIIPLESHVPWFYLQFESKLPYCYLMLIFLFAEILLAEKIVKSKLGYYFVAIREDELASESLGINTLRYKLISFVISAAFTSLAGTLYAFFVGYIAPETVLSDILTVQIVIVAILGGAGTIYGSLIGAFIMVPLMEYTRAFLGARSGLDLIVLGSLIILICVLYPHGLIKLIGKIYHKLPRIRGDH